MTSSYDKSVKGATKVKNAPPKDKYIEHILIATHSGEARVAEVFRSLQHRLRDSTWTVVFKSLIVVHMMIRDGSPDITLAYLAKHRNLLAISSFTDAQTQGRNIRHYAMYLAERARAYRDTKCDWVRCKESRLENMSVNKGLLRETEAVQHQLTALLKCDVMDEGIDSEITLTVFRLLVLDLMALFQMLNQGLIQILRHFFEMSKPDAERALDIYRTFTKQTDFVVQYLSVARQYVHHTQVEVPKLKHAPVNLGRQLEEYLKDPDFEINRRQYIAETEAKKSGKLVVSGPKRTKSEPAKSAAVTSSSTNGSQSTSKPQAAKSSEPDLIDLIFDSIEQPQTSQIPMHQPQITGQQLMAGQLQMAGQFAGDQQFQSQPNMQMQPNMTGYAQNGVIPQSTGFSASNPFQQQNQNPFGQHQQQQVQPSYTGAGFGSFSPQPSFQPGSLGTIPQESVPTFQQNLNAPPQAAQQLQPQATGTNPFRQTLIFSQPTGASATSQKPTNPFSRSSPPAATPFQPSSASPYQGAGPTATPLQAQATGTNPFMPGYGAPTSPNPAQSPAPLAPQATGTNPFRQQQTGRQPGQPGSILDQMSTIQVFPRPGQQQQQQSSTWQ